MCPRMNTRDPSVHVRVTMWALPETSTDSPVHSLKTVNDSGVQVSGPFAAGSGDAGLEKKIGVRASVRIVLDFSSVGGLPDASRPA